MDLHEPRQPRLSTSHPASFRPRSERTSDEPPRMGQVRDVSESGFKLVSAVELEKGAEIDLEIVVEGEILFARGKVVRSLPDEDGLWECGLTWTGIPTESLFRLLYSKS